ncbi:hypothetical protein MRB53_028460 [Persea americana]|uniref:Uncharacterized protein n=1 Tax=Persea americana TaxID=3435 RepID=A0ACC2KFN4_PERAE|nr:hypothetical protein MRB53_028460 [Persea americana]
MLIKEENQKIDENSTVYIDAKGKVLVYRVEKNEGLVNVVMGQKSDILIGLPNGPRNNAASGGEVDEDRNGRVEKSLQKKVTLLFLFLYCRQGGPIL